LDKIAAKLIAARKAKGLTQGDVAEALGLKPRTYQRYEAGDFPKYRNDFIREVDRLLGTSLYVELYDKEGDTWNIGVKNAPTRQETAQGGHISPEPGVHPDHAKYVALLERTNATLEQSIQLSLNSIQESQADLRTFARENDNRTLELLRGSRSSGSG
jgi:transcriptional regulator with XRE-family HTH domain